MNLINKLLVNKYLFTHTVVSKIIAKLVNRLRQLVPSLVSGSWLQKKCLSGHSVLAKFVEKSVSWNLQHLKIEDTSENVLAFHILNSLPQSLYLSTLIDDLHQKNFSSYISTIYFTTS